MNVYEHAWRLIWPCDCWFCRRISRPLLSRLLKEELPMLDEMLMERERKMEEMRKMSESSLSGIDEIKNEIAEIRKSIMDLKKALVEIKAVMSDISSPYAVLSVPHQPELSAKEVKIPAKTTVTKSSKPLVSEKKVGESRKEVEKGERIMEQHGVPSIYQEYGRELEEYRREGREKAEPMSLEDMKQLIRELGSAVSKEVEESKEEMPRRIGIKRMVKILRTIYMLRKALPKESIENIIKLAEIMGLITKEEKETLLSILSLVEDGLKQNMTFDDQIIVLYILLKNLGYEDEELEDELMKIISNLVLSKKEAKHGEEEKPQTLQQLLRQSSD